MIPCDSPKFNPSHVSDAGGPSAGTRRCCNRSPVDAPLGRPPHGMEIVDGLGTKYPKWWMWILSEPKNPSKPIEIHQDPWKSIEIHNCLMDFRRKAGSLGAIVYRIPLGTSWDNSHGDGDIRIHSWDPRSQSVTLASKGCIMMSMNRSLCSSPGDCRRHQESLQLGKPW